MSDHKIHDPHSHSHDSACGHTAIKHDDHVDYLHDGHLHSPDGGHGHVHEHVLADVGANRSVCTPAHTCGSHDNKHSHGSGCGHEAVPHSNHTDYLVKSHLHHPDKDHCDDHGTVTHA
jgi:hypothetical protein